MGKPPPKWVLSKTVSHTAIKLAIDMQGTNRDTPAKFRCHSLIITPFNSHECDIQGHLSQNVSFIIYPYDHARM